MNNIEKLWSDILAYKPYIYVKNRTIVNDKVMYEEDKSKFTITLNNFIENSPLTIYKSIDNTILGLDNLLTSIKNDTNFEDEDMQNVYNIIYKDKEYLSSFIDKYINLYYKCDKEDLQKEENKYLEILQKYDTEDRTKINYFSIYYDSYINSMIKAFSENILNQDNDLFSEVTIIKEYSNIKNNNIKDFIKEDYKHLEDNLNYNLENYNNILDKDMLYKTFYRACDYKNKINSFINGFNEVDKTGDSFFINKLYDIKDKSIDKLDSYCTDIFKTITLSSIYKNDYIDNISYIHSCKNLYKYL